MAWYWIVLLSVLGFLVCATLAAGYTGFRQALTRRKVKGASSTMQSPDPNAALRAAGEEAGRAWLFAQNPEEVEIKSRDGLTLRGYFLAALRPSGKLVVCVHGYSYNGPDQFGALLPFYHEENYHILLPDHRAHGRSDGTYIGFCALEWRDMFDWTEAFVRRLGADTRVVLHGISMGGATVMNCNAHNPPECVKCVVEDCGFTNGYEMVSLVARRDLHIHFPPMMWACRMWYRLVNGCSLRYDADPYGRMGQCKLPMLFIHGESDPFVPVEMGRRCFEAAAVPKDLLLIEGAGHSMSYFLGKERYDAKLRAFFAQWMEEAAPSPATHS